MRPKIPWSITTIAALWLTAASANSQSTFTNFHNFSTVTVFATNLDGANSYSGLTLSGATMFGVTVNGGKSSGTIFSINTDGSSFSNLYSFSELAYNPSLQNNTNPDGAAPAGELACSGTNLYGVTQNGGKNGAGVIFSIGTNGSGFTVLHTFSALVYDATSQLYTNADGSTPYAGLILSGNTVYGTTAGGGSGSAGTIFSMDVSTLMFSNLHNFTATTLDASTGTRTNGDGSFPWGSLDLMGGVLYGTTQGGGTAGVGTVFRIDAGGLHFTTLHNFAPWGYNYTQSAYTNRDGIYPEAGLVSDGSLLYGTTYMGATTGYGTVFRVDLNGNNFTNLYNLTYGDDGANLRSALILSNNTLVGTAENGGTNGYGTVFQLTTNGMGFNTVYSFSEASQNAAGDATNSDGAMPDSKLILSGGALYGTTPLGGVNGNGTVFAINLPSASGPVFLNFQWSGTNLVLDWTNAAYLLQTASTLNGAFSELSGATSPYTNATAGSPRFFRLRLP